MDLSNKTGSLEKRSYSYYKNILKDQRYPLGFVDLDYLDRNIADLDQRIENKGIRIATKSIRCRYVLERIIANSSQEITGFMCFSGEEAIWLAQQKETLQNRSILMGYPIVDSNQLEQIAQFANRGISIYLMCDSPLHLELANKAAAACNAKQAICLDIDMSTSFPGLHFGVRRSPITQIEHLDPFLSQLEKSKQLQLRGIMGYEAQIAGVGDQVKGASVKSAIVRSLKKKSIPKIAKRRTEILEFLKSKGHQIDLVNAGGTGSIESSKQEEQVTEITIGSGYFASGLFDHYRKFKHLPAAAFGIQIVRIPKPNTYTAFAGGYIASGAIGKDKAPAPYLPIGANTLELEGCGEVQTPVEYSGVESLKIGDPLFFRHSKAGELCERFNKLHLISEGKIIQEIPTYRGEGKCFG